MNKRIIQASNNAGASKPETKQSGFTLIELMIVVAIMAILTMIAYPGYQESIRKSRRSDGIAAALAIQAAQEKFRSGCVVYADEFGSDNDCVTATDTYVLKADDTSPEEYYAMSLSGTSGNGYTITATAQGAQADDTLCQAMVITFDTAHPNGDRSPAICWP